MTARDLATLWLLAAIWGLSFLFMRYAAPAFGPIGLIQIRVATAALCLLPWLLHRNGSLLRRGDLPRLALVGVSNSAFPFVLLTWATLELSAGLTSILNSTVPLFSALVGWIWLRDRLNRWQCLGILVGALGVLYLAEARTGLRWGGSLAAMLACVVATISYGFSANYSKVWLSHLQPIVIAGFSLGFATLALIPFTLITLPERMPGVDDWAAAIIMGVVCTAIAYVLFYRLIASLGATRTVMVTYLVPVFGMFWGVLWLDEEVTREMLAGCLIILAGTSLTLELLRPKSLLAVMRRER